MQLIEIRDLDGPNLFLLQPAIKIELASDDPAEWASAASRLDESGERSADFATASFAWIARAHELAGLGNPETGSRQLDTSGHIAIVFSWSHRRVAMEIAREFAAIATGTAATFEVELIRELAATTDADDAPLMIPDSARHIPVVGITGTNGKTTTTRLLAHILMQQGKHVGWSSSSGVYIDGVEVLEGDYSGPSGARRVLAEPGIDVAVLETARGGILLRGVACESNDVSVFTNISADHLDLQGVRTVETLAEVKSVVTRITKPGGTVVVNADDPIVLAVTSDVRASLLYFFRTGGSPLLEEHLALGGSAILEREGDLVFEDSFFTTRIIPVAEIPITFGGRAGHMVENAMAAAGAAYGLGLKLEEIATGLRSFRNSTDLNLGRLNVFDVNGVTVIMDFAHNEVGLELLLSFGRNFLGPDGRMIAIIGTAGDRTPTSLRALGRIAGEQADVVIVKLTYKYNRGRSNDEMLQLYLDGVREAGRSDEIVEPDELAATKTALAMASKGDVIAIMCQEFIEEIRDLLATRGTSLS